MLALFMFIRDYEPESCTSKKATWHGPSYAREGALLNSKIGAKVVGELVPEPKIRHSNIEPVNFQDILLKHLGGQELDGGTPPLVQVLNRINHQIDL